MAYKITPNSVTQDYLDAASDIVTGGKRYVYIPFSDIDCDNDARIIGMVEHILKTCLMNEGIEVYSYLDYQRRAILLFRRIPCQKPF